MNHTRLRLGIPFLNAPSSLLPTAIINILLHEKRPLLEAQ